MPLLPGITMPLLPGITMPLLPRDSSPWIHDYGRWTRGCCHMAAEAARGSTPLSTRGWDRCHHGLTQTQGMPLTARTMYPLPPPIPGFPLRKIFQGLDRRQKPLRLPQQQTRGWLRLTQSVRQRRRGGCHQIRGWFLQS